MRDYAWRKGNPLHVGRWECILATATPNNSLRMPKKKMSRELSLGSDISTPGLLPRETIIQKDTSTTMFTEALLTIAKTQNQQNIHQQVND